MLSSQEGSTIRQLASAQYWTGLAVGNTGRLFLTFVVPVYTDRISNCPLDRVLTYKNLNLLIKFANLSLTELFLYEFKINVKPELTPLLTCCTYFRTDISSQLRSKSASDCDKHYNK